MKAGLMKKSYCHIVNMTYCHIVVNLF